METAFLIRNQSRYLWFPFPTLGCKARRTWSHSCNQRLNCQPIPRAITKPTLNPSRSEPNPKRRPFATVALKVYSTRYFEAENWRPLDSFSAVQNGNKTLRGGTCNVTLLHSGYSLVLSCHPMQSTRCSSAQLCHIMTKRMLGEGGDKLPLTRCSGSRGLVGVVIFVANSDGCCWALYSLPLVCVYVVGSGFISRGICRLGNRKDGWNYGKISSSKRVVVKYGVAELKRHSTRRYSVNSIG
ncbi:hypothetical protein J3F83DRAFT_334830 [Trichoderma novae-zelandiae]